VKNDITQDSTEDWSSSLIKDVKFTFLCLLSFSPIFKYFFASLKFCNIMIFLKAGCFFFNEDFLKIPMEKILFWNQSCWKSEGNVALYFQFYISQKKEVRFRMFLIDNDNLDLDII